MNDKTINIRCIQHYMYCPRRFALLELNDDWQEKKRSVIIHPYLNEKIQLGMLPFIQSSLLAKYIRGEIDEYPCYLLK